MSKGKIGGSVLKSVISILTAVAVLVLTLPAYKMDSLAVNHNTDWEAMFPGFMNQDFNYTIGLLGDNPWSPTGCVILQRNGDTLEPLDTSGTISEGTFFIPGSNSWPIFGISVNGIENLTQTGAPVPLGEGEQMDFYTYRLNGGINYSISTLNITVTPLTSPENSTNTDNNSTGQKSSTLAASAGQPMDSATIARLWSEFNAWLAARDQAIRAGQEAAKIRKEQQAQLDRDNLYFRNIAEFNRNGIYMFVNPDHSVIPSTIPGLYWANNVPGFAAQAIDPTQAGNLLIETWNINASKAPKSWGVIMQVATDNGYTVGAAFQANIGEKGPDNKPVYTSTNKAPVANLIFGVPGSIQREGAQFGAIGVLPGGEIHIYNALPFENGHVTLGLPIGEHAIGVVRTN